MIVEIFGKPDSLAFKRLRLSYVPILKDMNYEKYQLYTDDILRHADSHAKQTGWKEEGVNFQGNKKGLKEGETPENNNSKLNKINIECCPQVTLSREVSLGVFSTFEALTSLRKSIFLVILHRSSNIFEFCD